MKFLFGLTLKDITQFYLFPDTERSADAMYAVL